MKICPFENMVHYIEIKRDMEWTAIRQHRTTDILPN